MRCRLIWLGLVLLAPAMAQAATPARIENEVLQASFDPDRAVLEVRDKRNGYLWRQNPGVLKEAGLEIPEVHATEVSVTDSAINVILNGEGLSAMTMEFGPESDSLYLTIHAEEGEGSYGVPPRFPYPFAMERDSGYAVQCTNSDGILIPLNELSSMRDPQGFAGAFSFTGGMPWRGVTDLEKGCIEALTSFQHRDVGAFPLKIRVHFTTDGGYVALAKYYRAVAELQGKVVTLRKKMAANPEIAQMAGAPVVYLWGPREQKDDLIKSMRAAGIRRAIVACGQDRDAASAANEAGFIPFSYDIYNNPANSADLLTQAKARVPAQLEGSGLKARFYDTLIPQVRASDTMNMEESRNARREVLRWTLQDLKIITGSGEGYSPDWAVPVLCWMEGAMTMRHYISSYLNAPYTTPEGREDWRSDRVEPAVVCKDAPPDATFCDVETNIARRIPLYGLVYHDCVITTWNWRGANHRVIGGQRAKDLINILFGSAPMWDLSPQIWAEKKDELLRGYHDVCEWNEKLAFDEMTSHRWLTNDRKVAETSFSSGWNVVVNMSNFEYVSEHGVVKSMSFLPWKQ